MTAETLIDELLQELTLEEKASLCSGRDEWTFKSVERLDIPAVWVADGPHGLRKSPDSATGGYGDQYASTCFPTASALSASWDRDLLSEVGKRIAIECQAADVHVILGPGVNIKRSPTGGRNFEYLSEDPVLAGELGAAYISGVQAQGVGTSIKHYACNSQETRRMVVSADMDERTLREIYLPNFEIAIRKAQPWTVMAAYNPVNGEDATANSYLLNDILKNEWGYKGIVISDWVSVFDRVDAVRAGMHVEMPGNGGVNDAKIVQAVESGLLDEPQLDVLVRETLRFVFKAKAGEKPGVTFSAEEHHAYARKVAAETFVLLKNENATLPITTRKYNSIALLGEFAISPRIQGNGSSEVKPTRIDKLLDEFNRLAADDYQVQYAQGYQLADDSDISLLEAAVQTAAQADIAVVHVGLPPHYESEGYDRTHIDMPPAQVRLIEEVARVQPNTVVVLTNGAAVAMPWVHCAAAVLETWLGGQAGAGAIADVLLGIANPCGKLAETFPIKYEDCPAFLDFPGRDRKLDYGEGIFTGYRWYDKRRITPLFPFGHGLSYTTFDYSDLELANTAITDVDVLQLCCMIKNTGDVAGKEIVQLYVSDTESRLIRPVKELKGFAKVELAPGATARVAFELSKRDFSYFDESFDSWITESGEFEIMIGASVQDIRLRQTVELDALSRWPAHFDERTTLREWLRYPETKALVYPVVEDFFKQQPTQYAGDLYDFNLHNDFFLDMPLVKYVALSRGAITYERVVQAVAEASAVTVKL